MRIAEPEEEAIEETEAWGASAGSTRDQELVFQKKILGDERLGSARLEEIAQASHHVKED